MGEEQPSMPGPPVQPFTHPYPPQPSGPIEVTVTDFDISFGRLVGLWFKATLAAIPALLLLAGIAGGVAMLLAVVGGVIAGLASR